MQLYIQVIKFIATLLITNSHYDAIYPIKALATGGSIGNSLFFAVSGYCIYSVSGTFLKWYKKKLIRIYPSVILATIIVIIISRVYPKTVLGYLKMLIYPTNYWFVSSILFFYVLYYIIRNTNLKNYVREIILFITIPYVFIYVFLLNTSIWIIESEGLFRWLFYFQMMLFGAIIRENKAKSRFENKGYINILLASIVVYFGFKFLMEKNILIMHFQFIIHLLTFPIVYCTFKCLSNLEDYLKAKANTLWFKTISFISNLTLEIYLIQFIIIKNVKSIIFPLNFLACTMLIIMSAYVINNISNKIAILLGNKCTIKHKIPA